MPPDDVFISYAHLDNQALSAQDPGWVSQFHEALTKRLGEVWGKAPQVWRDPKLQGNDVFDETLDARVKQAAVLVSVVTPRYLNSDWCLRELNGFWQSANAGAGAVLDHKARVFKVVKTPVDPERVPAPVKPLLGYEFYKLQPGSGRPLEFNKVYGPDAEHDFWLRLNDLAYDVADVLQRLDRMDHDGGEAAGAHACAYLASTTSDLQPQRDALRRELLRQGWRVRPDVDLPLVGADLERTVRAQLEPCMLTVHMVGPTFGVVPEGSAESSPALQARLAGERAAACQVSRLVWIAPGTAPADERQRAWIAALRDAPMPNRQSDLLETDFDELQQLVIGRLELAQAATEAQAKAQAEARAKAQARSQTPGEPTAAPATTPALRVYVVCAATDIEGVLPLRAHLFRQGCEVVLPAFEGDEAALRRANDAELRDCDGLLVYYGEGGELWLREKLAELRRLPALGRSAPLRASGICVAPPATPAKRYLLTRDAPLLAMPDGFTPAALQPFVDALLPPR